MENRLCEILVLAYKLKATDIHLDIMEGEKEKISIDLRIGQDIIMLPPKENDIRLFNYLKYRANLDVSDAFSPQSGSFNQRIGNIDLSLRFSVVSSYRRKNGVLRILNNHQAITIASLSDDLSTYHYLSNITKHHDGLFIFSGPTGSGKTTTVYTLLDETKGKKIFTLEDPIEVISDKYVQIQVNEKQHLSYAEGIKQLMRHDPDVILIGEIRDSEAAKMAIRTAMTGHLVLTTIHSFSCCSVIDRLLDLGVEKYQLQDVLTGISSQRLFEYKGGEKRGIYEFMDKKELAYFFENKKTSEYFIPISKRISNALNEKKINEKQAQPYLI